MLKSVVKMHIGGPMDCTLQNQNNQFLYVPKSKFDFNLILQVSLYKNT